MSDLHSLELRLQGFLISRSVLGLLQLQMSGLEPLVTRPHSVLVVLMVVHILVTPLHLFL